MKKQKSITIQIILKQNNFNKRIVITTLKMLDTTLQIKLNEQTIRKESFKMHKILM